MEKEGFGALNSFIDTYVRMIDIHNPHSCLKTIFFHTNVFYVRQVLKPVLNIEKKMCVKMTSIKVIT